MNGCFPAGARLSTVKIFDNSSCREFRSDSNAALEVSLFILRQGRPLF